MVLLCDDNIGQVLETGCPRWLTFIKGTVFICACICHISRFCCPMQ